MRFAKTYGAEPETNESTGAGGYIRYFKNEETTFRILQDPQDWLEYWEHYNPGGFPFPCTGDRQSCPGCTSSNEKMKKASKRVAINVLEGEWVNVYKFPKTLADKLKNRADRIGTVTDRDYTIFKNQSKNNDGSMRTDYDIEGGDKIPVDVSKLELKDVEAMLAAAYDQAWGDGGDSGGGKETVMKAEDDQRQSELKRKLETEGKNEEPKADDANVYTEEQLRAMSVPELSEVLEKEGMNPPGHLVTVKEIVDWLLEQ